MITSPLLHRYKNGNVEVSLYADGTKVREWPDDEAPYVTHPESCDLKITQYCDLASICVYCFVPGTQISLVGDKTKSIEDIAIGDEVWSFNTTNNEFESQAVYNTFINDYNGDVIDLELTDGVCVSMTPNHKVLTQRGYVRADELTLNDKVLQFP